MLLKILRLYKEILYIGRDYPMDYKVFKQKLKKAFNLPPPAEIINHPKLFQEYTRSRIEHGEYVKKEMIALIQLKKYRAMKRNYYNGDNEIIHRYEKDQEIESD